jgi:hypothetical protein
MVSQVMHPEREVPLSGDVYRVQRRPSHQQLLINDGYQGLAAVDPWSGAEPSRWGLPAGYDESGIIDAWCLRADGRAALVLSAEPRTAAWLSLEAGPCFDMPAPPLKQVTDLRYLWEEDTFWLSGGKSLVFFQLAWRDGRPVFERASSIEARKQRTAWRVALDALSVERCTVLRVEPDQGRMLYIDASEGAERMGVVSWRGGAAWSVPFPAPVSALACEGNRLFALREYEFHRVNPRGEVEAVYPAPEGYHFVGLDTFPAEGSTPAALVLVCSALSDATRSLVRVYRLED